MQGQLPGHLSELGKQQAEALAEMLDKEELDVIVCSDLARSYDTAMAVARRKGLQPVATPLLREMDWGDYHRAVGKTDPRKDTEFTNHEEYGMHAFHAAVIF